MPDPTRSFEGRRVLVTGGSAGLGAEMAKALAERGATVGIVGRRADRLDAVLAELRRHGSDCRSFRVDLGDLDAVDDLAAAAVAELGGVDVLVNNAGIPKRRWAWATTPAEVEEVTRVNYLSPVRLTLALLPELVARSGSIVYVGSVAARLTPPAEAAYAATKAAITAWAECLAVDLEVGGRGVDVHVVHPGVLATELFGLPDNDASISGVEPLPPASIVEPLLAALAPGGPFEQFVPGWFADIVPAKATDVDAFLAGSVGYTRDRLVELGRTAEVDPT